MTKRSWHRGSGIGYEREEDDEDVEEAEEVVKVEIWKGFIVKAMNGELLWGTA